MKGTKEAVVEIGALSWNKTGSGVKGDLVERQTVQRRKERNRYRTCGLKKEVEAFEPKSVDIKRRISTGKCAALARKEEKVKRKDQKCQPINEAGEDDRSILRRESRDG